MRASDLVVKQLKVHIVPKAIRAQSNYLILNFTIRIAFQVSPRSILAITSNPVGLIKTVVERLDENDLLFLEDSVEGVSDVIQGQFASFWMKNGESESAVAFEFDGADCAAHKLVGVSNVLLHLIIEEGVHHFQQLLRIAVLFVLRIPFRADAVVSDSQQIIADQQPIGPHRQLSHWMVLLG